MNFDWHQHPNAHFNFSPDRLIQLALRHKEGTLTNNEAFVALTGSRTGRSPQDRFFVQDTENAKQIEWGKTNQPFDSEKFDKLFQKVVTYLKTKEVFIRDAYVCADPSQRFTLKVVTELAWHNLFCHHLFLRYENGDKPPVNPDMTLLVAPHFRADPKIDGTHSETFVILNFQRRIILIGGTHYAGEMKKAIFTTLNYLLPAKGVLTMHCSANIGGEKDVALFFGLSGTGKTTLSADPKRKLIGDDEHAWNDHGVFNLEGGCYAKCIKLSKEFEPQIWGAIKQGTVLENVVMNAETKEADYNDGSITENTRAAYPLYYIPNAVIPSIGGHPKVIFFLTADAFGVLPPVAKLNSEEAMYHFLSGYTSKLAGTEVGVTTPQATFSSCFGAPFLPRAATFYGKMFQQKIAKHQVPVYLINTGWTGGIYGVGKRISLPYTRAIIEACLNGALEKTNFKPNKQFHLNIPGECPGVPKEILEPSNTWKSKEDYALQAEKLANLFAENYKKFK